MTSWWDTRGTQEGGASLKLSRLLCLLVPSLHSSPQSQQAPRPHPASYSVAVHVQHRRLCPPTCGQLLCFISTPEGLRCVYYFAQTHTVSGVLRTNNKPFTCQRLLVLLDSGSLVVTSHLCCSSSKKPTTLCGFEAV